MNRQRRFSIVDLPDDCLFQIFQFIPGTPEKLLLQKVCRRFFQIVHDYFLSHRAAIKRCSHFKACRTVSLEHLMVKFPKLTSLAISNCTISNSISDVCLMRHLTFLEINIASTRSSKDQLETFFKKCPNLETLILNAFNRKFFNFDCLSLRLKNVVIEEKFFKPLVDIFKKRGSQLVKVRLDNCGETKVFKLNDIVSSISKHCVILEELEIEGWFSGSQIVLPKVKTLKKLKMYMYWQKLTYEMLEDMLQSMPNLITFEYDFKDCPRNDKLLELAYRFCGKIEVIFNAKSDYTDFYSNFVTQIGLDIWRNLINLKTVDDRSFEDWSVLIHRIQYYAWRRVANQRERHALQAFNQAIIQDANHAANQIGQNVNQDEIQERNQVLQQNIVQAIFRNIHHYLNQNQNYHALLENNVNDGYNQDRERE